ncbi:MAG: hypothetical protein RLY86_1884 [Pseudomonadota bacterium]|jgi:hypothetical protein
MARPFHPLAGPALLTLLLLPTAAAAGPMQIRPELAIETRWFPADPAAPAQMDGIQAGLILTGDIAWTSPDRTLRVRVEPYLRLDGRDGARRYADLREASLAADLGDWAVLAGFSQVFWGVVESRNIVDVINQIDTVEDIDEGEKLGQPLLRLSRRIGSGMVEAYWMPWFRERRHPGPAGPLRPDPAVDDAAGRVDRDGGRWAGDVALRYSGRRGDYDIGLHAFHGTGRSPRLEPNAASGRLDPVYLETTQAGADIQYTTGPWLLKGELVLARSGGDSFAAAVGGVEYTLFDLGGSGLDLGLIAEYLHDGRDPARAPATPFDDDVFAGLRLTWNDAQDTELLAGAIVDTANGGTQGSVEFQRRWGDTTLLEVEARWFTASGDALLAPLRRDEVLTLRLTRYF